MKLLLQYNKMNCSSHVCKYCDFSYYDVRWIHKMNSIQSTGNEEKTSKLPSFTVIYYYCMIHVDGYILQVMFPSKFFFFLERQKNLIYRNCYNWIYQAPFVSDSQYWSLQIDSHPLSFSLITFISESYDSFNRRREKINYHIAA